MDGLRIDLLAGRVERPFDDGFAHALLPSSYRIEEAPIFLATR
jgi:hypothetical protein